MLEELLNAINTESTVALSTFKESLRLSFTDVLTFKRNSNKMDKSGLCKSQYGTVY